LSISISNDEQKSSIKMIFSCKIVVR